MRSIQAWIATRRAPQQSNFGPLCENATRPDAREARSHGPVVSGMLYNQIAFERISEITVEIHRGQVMRKMQAQSLAELVRNGVETGTSTRKKISLTWRRTSLEQHSLLVRNPLRFKLANFLNFTSVGAPQLRRPVRTPHTKV